MNSTVIIVTGIDKLNELKSSLANFHQEKINLGKMNKQDKLIFPVSDGFEIIPFDDIIFCESDNSSTTFHLNKAKCKRKVISKGIGKVMEILPQELFFRIHNKYIINRNYISRFNKLRNEVHLNCLPHPLPVSRNKKSDFLIWMGVRNNP